MLDIVAEPEVKHFSSHELHDWTMTASGSLSPNRTRGGGWDNNTEGRGKLTDDAIPPIPQSSSKPRRRLYSRSDIELAVPLSVEIWNFVLPTGVADDDDDDEDDDADDVDINEDKQSVDIDSSWNAAQSASFAATTANKNNADSASTTPTTTMTSNTATRKTTRWYKLLRHQTSILEQIKMQMVVQEERTRSGRRKSEQNLDSEVNGNEGETGEIPNASNEGEGEKGAVQKEEIILFQGSNDNGLTVNPSWFHLQEKLSGNMEWINLHRDTYETLEFRFSVVDKKQNGDCSIMEPSCSHFLTVPGHPSQLVSLGSNNNALTNLKMSSTLPINTVVVHYSDQSSRILPAHFRWLTKQQQSQIFPGSAEEKSMSSLPTWSSPMNHHHRQSSLVPRWKKDQDMMLKGDGRHNKDSVESFGRKQRFRDDAFKALDRVQCANDVVDVRERSGRQMAATQQQTELNGSAVSHFEDPHMLTSGNAIISEELRRERQILLQSIEEEMEAYQREKQEVAELHAFIRDNLTPQLEKFDEQTRQVREATQEEYREIETLDLLIEMHRIRLVRGLEACYPVTEAPPQATTTATTASTVSSYLMSGGSSAASGYSANSANSPTLRGWTLPSPGSLFSSATDDELSAVLGALSHVVLLLAKYLGVPLRYRIFSNSSRSAIQDDRGIIHPLFLARPVEREQVAQGLVLLDRNVTCIAQSRGVLLQQTPTQHLLQSPSDLHIFEKVRQLYLATTQGPTA